MRDKNPLQVAAAEIRAELERILASPEFRTSRRGRDFLRHTVERVLAGQAEALKERTIAVELFGRSPEADLEKDSSVRVCARHVRQRLAAYYASPAAAGCRWRIELPLGSYVPVFTPVADSIPAPPPAEPRWRRWALPALVVAVLAPSSLLLWHLVCRTDDAMNRFWAPAWRAGQVCIVLAPHSDEATSAAPSAAVPLAASVAELVHSLGHRGIRVSVSDAGEGERAVSAGAVIFLGQPFSAGNWNWIGSPPVDLSQDRVGDPEKNLPATEKSGAVSGAGREYIAELYRIPSGPNRPFTVILSGRNPHATRCLASLVLEPASMEKLVVRFPRGWERQRLAASLRLRRSGENAEFDLITSRLW